MAEARYTISAKDKSDKALRSARQNLRAFRKSVLNVRTAMIALASAAAMGAVIKKAADYADNIDKARKVSGVTAETLQELRFAFGQLADVTDQQVDLGLQKFRRRLDLARDGMGAGLKTLEKLNVSLDQDTQSALDEVIEKLQALSKETDIAGEASQLFGEEIGPKLAEAIATGDIAGLRREIQELGGVLSGEAVRGGAELNDEIDKLARVLKTQLFEAILENKEEIVAFVRTVQEGAVEVIRWVGRMTRQWEVSKMDRQIERLRRQIELVEEFGRTGGRSARAQEAMEITRQYENQEAALQALRAELKKAKQAQLEFLTGGGAPTPTPFTAAGGGGGGAGGAGGGGGGGGGGAGALDPRVGLMDPGLPTVLEVTETLEKNLAAMRDHGDDVRKVQADLTDGQRELNRAAEDTGRAIGSAFMEAADRGRDLRGVLGGLLQDLQRIILRANVSDPLAALVTGALSGGGNGGGASLGVREAGAFGTRAHGGPVSGGGAFLVGERGPELFQPSGSGRIIPNDRLRGGGQPMVNHNNVTIHADGADAAQLARVEQAVESLNRSLERRAVNAVVEDSARGGRSRRVA